MFLRVRDNLYRLLRWSEKYTKTDMVYLSTSGFWLMLGQIVSMAASFILSVLFANYLSKEKFGTYKYILAIAGSLSAFSLSGMNTAVTRAVPQGFDGTFKYSLLLQIKWTIPQFLLSLGVAFYYFWNGNSVYAVAFVLVAIFGPISNVANTFNAFLHGKKDFKTSTSYISVTTLLYLLATTLVVFFVPEIVWLIAAYYVVISLSNVFFCYRTLKKYPPKNQTLRDEDVSYAKHLSAMNVISSLAQHADSLIVYHLLGPAQLAIYTFSILLPDRIRNLLGTVSAAVLPKLAEKNSGTRESLARKIVQLAAISVPMIVIYVIIVPIVFHFLFPNYLSSVAYAQLYGLTLLTLPSCVTLPALYSRRQEGALYTLNILVPVLKIFLSFISITLAGILGAILARIAFYLVHMGVSVFYVYTDNESIRDYNNHK